MNERTGINAVTMLHLLIDTYYNQIKEAMVSDMDQDLNLGYKFPLPKNRVLTVFYKTKNVETPYFEWTVRCSPEEAKTGVFHATGGVVDTIHTKTCTKKDMKNNIAWAIYLTVNMFDN